MQGLTGALAVGVGDAGPLTVGDDVGLGVPAGVPAAPPVPASPAPASSAELSASGLSNDLPVAAGLVLDTGAALGADDPLGGGVAPPTDGELGGVLWFAGEVDVALVDGDELIVGDPLVDGLPEELGEPDGDALGDVPDVQLGVDDGLGPPPGWVAPVLPEMPMPGLPLE